MNYLPYQKLGVSRLLPFRGYLTVLSNMAASASAPIKSINYDQLIEHIENKTYLVDVREKQELSDTGTLPSSVNIPVGEVGTALQMSEDEYVSQYKACKPRLDQEIIFSCRSGKRSLMAAELATKLGFQKVLNYSGGWLDWEKHQSHQN